MSQFFLKAKSKGLITGHDNFFFHQTLNDIANRKGREVLKRLQDAADKVRKASIPDTGN